MYNLHLSPEQLEFRDTVRDFVEDEVKPVTLKATFHHTPETVRRAFALITERKIRANDYITGEAPLSRLQHVLRHMSNRNGDIKTAIIPGH